MDGGMIDDIKTVLKSLIISCPRGMTIDQLNRDYRSMEGRGIPFGSLGYPKLENFLRSLTDTLVVTGTGSDAKVMAIVSEKCKHIDKLVSKQKNSTKFRTVVQHTIPLHKTPPPPSIPTRLKTPPPPLISNRHYKPPQPILSNSLHTPPPPKIPSYNRQINYNTASFGNFLQQHQLMQHQYNMNSWVNSHYYYNNMQQIALNAVNNNIYNHINQQNYAMPAQNPMNVMYSNYREVYKPSHPVHTHNTSRNNQKEQTYNHRSNNSDKRCHQTSKDTINTNNSNEYPINENHQQKNIIETKEHPEVTVRCNSNKENNNNESIKNKISNDNNIMNNNCKNNNIIVSENCDTIIHNKTELKHSHENINNLNKQLSDVNEKLSVKSDELLTKITENMKKLTLESKTPEKKTTKNNQEAVPELQMNDLIFQLDYPLDAVKYGENIPKSEIPSNITETSYFGIFVSEVHNPFKFWFHLFKEEGELDTLMQEIENFYTHNLTPDLQMQSSCIKPGQVCSALFMGMWHRAEIIENPQDGKVKVFFVDYGTVSHIDLQNIKYLLSEFSALPSQALRGCLAHIKPVTHRWSRDATYAFLDMVSDLLLYAKAVEINHKDRVIRMVLTDTNKDLDFQINDALIRKGHARYCPSVDYTTSSESQIQISPKRHFQDKYPTFDMLECGEYPTFCEIGDLLGKGINFEEIEDQNIIPDVDSSLEEITRELISCNVSKSDIDDNDEGAVLSSSEYDIGNFVRTDAIYKDPTNPFLTTSSVDDSSEKSFKSTLNYLAKEFKMTTEIKSSECYNGNPFTSDNSSSPKSCNNTTQSYPINYQQHPIFYPISMSQNTTTLHPPPGFEHIVPRPLTQINQNFY